MRNRLIAVYCLLCCVMLSLAQNIYEGQTAIVYSMPKSVLVFEVEMEKQIQEPGPFYLYAKRFLGASEVITEHAENYKMLNVHMKVKTVADATRQYVIPLNMKDLPSIQINDNGILCSINKQMDLVKKHPSKKHPSKKEHPKPLKEKDDNLMPLGEEQMQANSIAKMAEGVAQQIYRIRENRLSLLMGDVDVLPADGEALKITLERLDREERELCELFVGKTITERQLQVVEYTPYQSVENHVLFRVSPLLGIVPSSDLSGAPVYLTLQAKLPEFLPETKKSAKNKENTVFYYNSPGSALITLSDGMQTYVTRELPMPQFGLSIPLPMSLFVKESYEAIFNPKTGVLLQLTQSQENK